MAGRAKGGNTKPYYEQISDRLIEQLEQGTAPFTKPWVPGEQTLPYNPTTGNEYNGSNSLWLQMQGRSDPRWLTYKQAQDVDAQVLKGERGTKIQYWKFPDKDDESPEGQKRTRPSVFSATVFNAEQVEGLPPLERKQLQSEWQRHERAEALLIASGASIANDQADRAFYRPSTDSIHLPDKASFPSADNYYSTALHELGHWTGHESRLNRDMSGGYGSPSYAKEELRAEISSLMVGSELGVGHDIERHASYVGSWIKALKDDPKEILRASRDADKIRSLVMSYDKQLESEQQAVKGMDPDEIMQKASEYAQRFSNNSDRQRFLSGVSAKLPSTDEKLRAVEKNKAPEL